MALRADPGPPARVLCALGWKRGAPFAATRDRVMKPVLITNREIVESGVSIQGFGISDQ
jgi:hypothetical protein